MSESGSVTPQLGILQRYYRPPYIGLLAFVAVLLAVPLAHSLVIAVRDIVGYENAGGLFLSIGVVAAVMLYIGARRNEEVSGTLLGFTAGMLIWIGWASYSFKFNEISLAMPMAEVAPGVKWPAHLLFIQGSLGICVATLLFFVFNKDTRCNAFRWLQKVLRMNLGDPSPAKDRNFCRITFLETIYVTWFCYATSLLLGDQRFLGYDHPVTYTIAGGLAIWGLYLLWRLCHYTRVMAAVRYAIPTKAIFWIPFGELAPRYGFYEEVWLNPLQYSAAMWTVLVAFLVLIIATGLVPQRRQSKR
ncbi:MAG: hypothetical protein RIF37_06530 [Rhodospirillaceae bacterium]